MFVIVICFMDFYFVVFCSHFSCTLKMLGYFSPNLDQMLTNPVIGLTFEMTFLTQSLGLSIFYPFYFILFLSFTCINTAVKQ